jgi:hypothetical protein
VPSAPTYGETVAAVTRGHRDPAAQKTQCAVVLGLDVGVLMARELVGGVEQERAEQVEGGVKCVKQRGPQQDEDQAQQQRESDAPAEHLGLHGRRDGEVAEDHGEHEDVVKRERALEQVAGEVLGARRAALPRP